MSVKLKVRNVSNDIINIIMIYIYRRFSHRQRLSVVPMLQHNILSTCRRIVTTYDT